MGLLQKFPIHKNILLVKNMIQLRESSLFCPKSNSQLIPFPLSCARVWGRRVNNLVDLSALCQRWSDYSCPHISTLLIWFECYSISHWDQKKRGIFTATDSRTQLYPNIGQHIRQQQTLGSFFRYGLLILVLTGGFSVSFFVSCCLIVSPSGWLLSRYTSS